MNVIFVKHGKKYNYKHVNRLYHSLRSILDADFYCYTEDNTGIDCKTIPIFNKPKLVRWWNKLSLFRKDFPLENKCMFFDLDIDVKYSFQKYLQEINWETLNLISAYYKRDNPKYLIPHAYNTILNSSVMAWTAGSQTHIWDKFAQNIDYHTRKYKGIDRFIFHENILYKYFPDGLVNSMDHPIGYDTPIDMYSGENQKEIFDGKFL